MTPERKAKAAAARHEKYASDPEYRALISERNHAQYVKNRDRRIEHAKAYYDANRDAKLERDRRRRADPVTGEHERAKGRAMYYKHHEERLARGRAYTPKKRLLDHGITQEQHDRMLQAQGGACAVCREPFTGTPRIDHDHRTGAVRGLLCHNCNVAIGHLRDNPAFLLAAMYYLEDHEQEREDRIKHAILSAAAAA